ncbi:MAG TPA: DNA gyrase inhibitor YacG [Phycisphaerae bacterium]|nr:DNA gyrase inhibitor YacG [Phycisphaerae bacterium]
MPSYECPTCRNVTRVARRTDAPYRPFCSERCRLVDLYHWFEGDYRVSDPLTPEPDAPGPTPQPEAVDEQ